MSASCLAKPRKAKFHPGQQTRNPNDAIQRGNWLGKAVKHGHFLIGQNQVRGSQVFGLLPVGRYVI
jgi:hypothetical protein